MKILLNITILLCSIIAVIAISSVVYFENVLDILSKIGVSAKWISKEFFLAVGCGSATITSILFLLKRNKIVKLIGAIINIAILAGIILALTTPLF
ncbi:MAG: hypothetical protein RR454_03355 [Clostridia bacterium]